MSRLACVDCGRRLRPRGAKAKSYPPGVVQLCAKGRCQHCYDRLSQGLPPKMPRRRKPSYERCIDCLRVMRPNSSRADEFPGLVKEAAAGRCGNCQSRFLQGLPPQPPTRLVKCPAPDNVFELVSEGAVTPPRPVAVPAQKIRRVTETTTAHRLPCGHTIITYKAATSNHYRELRRQHQRCGRATV